MIELEIFLYTCAVDGSECIWYFSFPFPLAKLGISTRLSKRNSPCVVVQSILWMRQIEPFSSGRRRTFALGSVVNSSCDGVVAIAITREAQRTVVALAVVIIL